MHVAHEAVKQGMKSLKLARKEAERVGDVDTLAKIGVAYLEFALHLRGEPEGSSDNQIGFQ